MQVNRQLWVDSSLFPEGLRPIVGCATDEGRAKGSKNFGWDKDFLPQHFPLRRLSSQKGTASAHKRQCEQDC